MDGNGGVDEVMRRRGSFISSSAFSVYLGANLTLSAMCLFILGWAGSVKVREIDR